jgi:hypothetical protein
MEEAKQRLFALKEKKAKLHTAVEIFPWDDAETSQGQSGGRSSAKCCTWIKTSN